jgi:uncharacterized membrane protein (UPF0136 family)
MPTTSIVFGGLLILLGIWGYFGTGTTSLTALIPCLFGLVLAVCGLLARNEKNLKMAMHVAAAAGLLGFLGTVRAWFKLPALWSGGPVARPEAVAAQSIMAALTLAFVALCVKSFVDVRRARRAAAQK